MSQILPTKHFESNVFYLVLGKLYRWKKNSQDKEQNEKKISFVF